MLGSQLDLMHLRAMRSNVLPDQWWSLRQEHDQLLPPHTSPLVTECAVAVIEHQTLCS